MAEWILRIEVFSRFEELTEVVEVGAAAEDDDGVALGEGEVSAGGEFDGAVGAFDGDDDGAGEAADVGVAQGLAFQGAVVEDGDVIHFDGEAGALGDELDEFHGGGVGEEGGDPVGADLGGDDDVVGAGLAELFLGAGLFRAGDDLDVGADLAGGEGDVDVFGVVGHDGDEDLGAGEAGVVEDFFLGGVAEDVEVAFGFDLGDFVGEELDDDEGNAGFGELKADEGADAAETGDDGVLGEEADLASHATVSDEVLDFAFGQELNEAGEGVADGEHAEGDDEDGVEPFGDGGERSYLAEADSGDGDDDHVEGVEEVPAESEVAEGAEEGGQGDGDDAAENAADGGASPEALRVLVWFGERGAGFLAARVFVG